MSVELGFLSTILKDVRSIAKLTGGIPQSADISDAIIPSAPLTVVNITGSGFLMSALFGAESTTGSASSIGFSLAIDGVSLLSENKPGFRTDQISGSVSISGPLRFDSNLTITMLNNGTATFAVIAKVLFTLDP